MGCPKFNYKGQRMEKMRHRKVNQLTASDQTKKKPYITFLNVFWNRDLNLIAVSHCGHHALVIYKFSRLLTQTNLEAASTFPMDCPTALKTFLSHIIYIQYRLNVNNLCFSPYIFIIKTLLFLRWFYLVLLLVTVGTGPTACIFFMLPSVTAQWTLSFQISLGL
jgi:hypothetical protein